jgi:hypothetical protein
MARTVENLIGSWSMSPASNQPRALGAFDADQQRERLVLKNSYSHRIIVFDTGIALVEMAPVRDALRAAIKYLALPAHLIASPHVKAAEQATQRVATALLALSPERRSASARLAAIQELSPESLAEVFPRHVTGLSTDQITSAVLRRIPPRELTIRYRQAADGLETELWLRLPSSGTADDAAELMSSILGPRFREAAPMEGARSVARGFLPFRGLRQQ